mgnify:CR=1 FL=1
MDSLSEQAIHEIKNICQRRHVRNLYVFGSVLTERFDSRSDIDFLVEFESLTPEDYADNYFDLCDDLEALLGRKADIVTLKSVQNPYFKAEIDKTRKLIYAA